MTMLFGNPQPAALFTATITLARLDEETLAAGASISAATVRLGEARVTEVRKFLGENFSALFGGGTIEEGREFWVQSGVGLVVDPVVTITSAALVRPSEQYPFSLEDDVFEAMWIRAFTVVREAASMAEQKAGYLFAQWRCNSWVAFPEPFTVEEILEREG
jgi:hypothetical protein